MASQPSMANFPGPTRIAMLGAHGTGKTTLAELLGARLDLVNIPEQAREVATEMGYTPATIPVNRFCEYQAKALERHYALECIHERGFVADQCVFSYGLYFDNPPDARLRETSEYRDVQSLYRYLIKQRAVTYSAIVYVPKMFELVQDGERHGETTFQAKVQSDIETKVIPLIHRISKAAEREIPLCTLTSNTPSARVDEVLKWVSSLKGKHP